MSAANAQDFFSTHAVREAATSSARYLGYTNMKPEQLEVVEHFLSGRDVFAVLPTGFGKTLCYTCLPGVFDALNGKPRGFYIVLIVSPLVALMKNQVSTCSEKGLTAAYVAADSDEETKEGVRTGAYQLVFFTPELLIGASKWRSMLLSDVYSERLKGFIVDEAHTVKKWGQTFRRIFERIGEVRCLLPPNTPVMALTATATKQLRLAVSATLGMKLPMVIAISSCKPNLAYRVNKYTSVEETFSPLLDKLKKDRVDFPRTIIYCNTFSMCGDIYLYLSKRMKITEPENAPNIPCFRLVDVFTSVTDSHHKDIILHLFTKPSQLRVVIATMAFGLGIDCPDVRQIIHVGSPPDIESYIQETGRAGRDGHHSLAILLKARTYHPCEPDIKSYASNDAVCRRDTLFQHTDNYKHVHLGSRCMCCDICALSCECGSCQKYANFVLFD